MMSGTGETGIFSVGRNFDSNSNPNLSSNSFWTLHDWLDSIILWKQVFAILTFVIAVKEFERAAGRSNAPGKSWRIKGSESSDSDAPFELSKFLVSLLLWSSPPFLILYGVGLYDLLKEKRSLLRFCILLLCLEKLCDILFLLDIHHNYETANASSRVFYSVSIVLNGVAMICAVLFRRRL